MEETRLKGKKTLLVPLEESHVEGLYVAGQFQEIWTYMTTTINSREDMKNYVQQALHEKENGTQIPFVIVEKKTGQIIGSTRFSDIDCKQKRLEMGFTWLTPAKWRTPINTECKYLLLEYAFEQLKLNRVQIKTDHENIRSQAAIERIGAKKEGILRNHMIRSNGTIRHTVMYSIIDSEWVDVKLHLEELLKNK
ncbi:GNAT family N-acetyltransferase [Viridibacillus sp. YIM B01967]|uniref:GNAT family N-acetyltransferase n=1 Tax=Viridibacillus soli TaxID=2798301 RepID=A0ABS1HDG4_9BACL|nr:GNAT family protein [Viridibacillus soli]MBK3497426.1 GNAT family N-acetyltransferase [Viridibacillus soli]